MPEVETLKELISPNALAWLGGGLAIGFGALGGAVALAIFSPKPSSRPPPAGGPAAGATADVHRLRPGGSPGVVRAFDRVHPGVQDLINPEVP